MFIYALKRISLIIPTIILIMIAAFFLSKLVPGDQAESLLELQGISSDSPNKNEEYQRNYFRLHLDKPNFYFSIVPDFYPQNLNEVSSPTRKNQIKAFLIQKFPYTEIIKFLDLRDSFIMNFKLITNDSIRISDNYTIQSKVSNLAFETVLKEINSTLNQLKHIHPGASSLYFNKFNHQFNQLISSKRIHYLPKLFWNGNDNQFHLWIIDFTKGYWGISVKDGRKVSEKITNALRWTILLLILNLIVTSLIAIPTGVYCGYKENSAFDKISSFLWLLFYSLPVYWLASMLIIYLTSNRYGEWLNIFPSPGIWIIGDGQGFIAQILKNSEKLILPVICLVSNDIAYLSRLTRNNMISQKHHLFAIMARAKGLPKWKVMTNHVLPNAMTPIITIIAGSIPSGLSGSLVIEVIFNIPGMGRLMFDSIYSADWNVVFGILIVISLCTIVFLLISDLLYTWLNPKITFGNQ